jgi:glycosidase
MTHRAPLSAHLVALAALLTACSTGSDPGVTETSGVDPSGPTSATPTSGLTLTTVDPTAATETTTTDGASATDPTAGPTTDPTDTTTTDPTGGDDPLCPTAFRFKPTGGLSAPRVAGEWHGFDLASAAAMSGPDGDGLFTAIVDLPPGLHAYKLVVKQGGGDAWIFDPTQPRRKYVGDTENSAIKVPDCRLPGLKVSESATARPGPGQGSYAAVLDFLPGVDGAPADPPAYEAILEHEDEQRGLTAQELAIDPDGHVTLAIGELSDGKYTVRLRAAAQDGLLSEPLRLVFWIEAQPFTWDGALVYMVLTDRFRDGAPGNNPGPTPLAEPRGDWAGGDLQGLTAAIADGTLDQLGVRAIWLTPFQTNPSGAYIAGDGVHYVTGYHGYWPIKAREVDPRLGGEAALKAMVKEAHAHGIRILQDYVINHVHEDHEYVQQHPEWFRTGCVCGTEGCDWTSKALECMFASYLPDINHSVPEANAAFTDDAIWWLDTFNLDGLRVDAVKHVEEVSTRNLAAEVREGFEAAGAHYFLMGETAMGWSDCGDPCNDENYGTIARYVGPYGLDGQFDFVLYHAVAYRTFAYSEKGMLHADYWLRHGLEKWPAGAVMTPYIGSHDTPRFASLADYRGQDAQHDPGVPGNQWNNVAQEPGDDEPYERLRIGMTWLLGLPGAPLLYYGDEYGQWGGADPNNRRMWRPEAQLTAAEASTLAHIRKLGAARRDLPALQRGAYVPLDVDEDTLVFGRLLAPGDAAIVALTRAGAPQQRSVDVNALGLKSQTTLADALGGPDVAVSVSGKINVTIPAKGALVLAPK